MLVGGRIRAYVPSTFRFQSIPKVIINYKSAKLAPPAFGQPPILHECFAIYFQQCVQRSFWKLQSNPYFIQVYVLRRPPPPPPPLRHNEYG